MWKKEEKGIGKTEERKRMEGEEEEEEEERREEEEKGRLVTKEPKREENEAEKAMSRKPKAKGTEKPKEERKRNRKVTKKGKGISGSKGQAVRPPFDHFPFDDRLSQCVHLFRQCRRLPLPLHVPFHCLFRLFSSIFCSSFFPLRPFFLRLTFLLLIVVHSSFAQQCRSLQPPCRCAPSVYEPLLPRKSRGGGRTKAYGKRTT